MRKWILLLGIEIEKNLDIKENEKILNKEMFLCSKFLERDDRHFHVWNYRNWVSTKRNTLDEINQEINFTRKKIDENFTNFSAWHFRAKYLKRYYQLCLEENNEKDLTSENFKEIYLFCMPIFKIQEEFKNLETGLYIQPDEQGIWQYHRWLIDNLIPIKVTLLF